MEVAFNGPDSTGRLEFTSEIHTIPDEYPFSDCQGYQCHELGMV